MSEAIDPGAREPVYRQLAAIIRARIESGEIPPGRMVPSKRQQKQEFGVSSESVDKAMAILREAGLIVAERGKGFYVVEQPSSGQ